MVNLLLLKLLNLLLKLFIVDYDCKLLNLLLLKLLMLLKLFIVDYDC